MCDVLFITPNVSSAVKHEMNGTMILGTLLLQDGFDVRILRYSEIQGYNENYQQFIQNYVDRILEMEPKSVSFYTIWTDYHIVLRLCDELKKRRSGLPLILGGPQGSALAMETLQQIPSVDYICTGEGENTICPFFRRLLRNEGARFSEIPGLYYRENGKILCNTDPIPLTDINALPHWDDRLLMKEYTGNSEKRHPSRYFMPIDVGRGCPFNCTFCSTSAFWHRTYRLKSPDRILDDIRYYHDKFGYTSFLFSHDALTANKQSIEALCDKILESGLELHWECSTRIDCLTPELVVKMKQAGLEYIHMGIETGSERMQKLTNKNLDLSKARSMVKTLLAEGLNIVLFFVYGVPEETEEDFNATLELIFDLCDLGAPDVQLIMCLFTPGAALVKQCYDQLVFEPEHQPVAMKQFGCMEEVEMIRNHKALFSTFYHLHTDVRDKYTYAKYLSLMYQKFPRTARYIRHFYHGDYLKFCRDFQENNRELLSMDIIHLEEAFNADPLKVFLNTIRNIDAPNIQQARELLRFEADRKRMKKAENGTRMLKTYGFRYQDYKDKKPIDQYSEGISNILMKKENGKVSMALVNVT